MSIYQQLFSIYNVHHSSILKHDGYHSLVLDVIVNQVQVAILLVVHTELAVALVPGHVEGGPLSLEDPTLALLGHLSIRQLFQSTWISTRL